MRRPTSVLALALVLTLAGLAGCNAVVGDSDRSTPTLTPVPVERGTETTDRPAVGNVARLPPGVTAAGIENVTRLVAAHTRAMRERSFVRRVRSTRVAGTGDSRSVGRLGAVTWAIEGTQVRRDLRTSFDRGTTAEAFYESRYLADGRVYRFTEFANGSVSRDVRPAATPPSVGAQRLARYLAVENTRVERVRRNGTVLYRITGTAPSDRLRRSLAVGLRLTKFRMTALVEPSGFVRQLRVRLVGGAATTRVRRVTRITYDPRPSLDVPEPDWLNRTFASTPNATDRPTATANGTAPG